MFSPKKTKKKTFLCERRKKIKCNQQTNIKLDLVIFFHQQIPSHRKISNVPGQYSELIPRNVTDFTLNPVDTGRRLNVHKTLRRRPERLLKVLCTFNLLPVFTRKTYNFTRRGLCNRCFQLCMNDIYLTEIISSS